MQKIELFYSRFTILLLLCSILILFAFPFIQINYRQNEHTYIQEVSGYQCASEYIINHPKIAISIPLIICLSTVVTCILIYIIKAKEEGYGFLLSLTGAISLLFFQVNATTPSIPLQNDDIYITQYTTYYWICLLLYTIICCISYIKYTQKDQKKWPTKNELHINIYTETNNKTK